MGKRPFKLSVKLVLIIAAVLLVLYILNRKPEGFYEKPIEELNTYDAYDAINKQKHNTYKSIKPSDIPVNNNYDKALAILKEASRLAKAFALLRNPTNKTKNELRKTYNIYKNDIYKLTNVMLKPIEHGYLRLNQSDMPV